MARAAGALGLHQPTPIQSAAIPEVLRGRDLLGTAQTGSGKTAAFLLPLLQQLGDEPPQTPRRTRVLVLVPTRELATQVGETVRALLPALPQRLKAAIVFGGVSINPQMMGLRGGADPRDQPRPEPCAAGDGSLRHSLGGGARSRPRGRRSSCRRPSRGLWAFLRAV